MASNVGLGESIDNMGEIAGGVNSTKAYITNEFTTGITQVNDKIIK
jgi:hypothetical protein